MADMEITPIRPQVGAEVRGIDLSRPVSPETRERLNDALVDHVALVIRDQRFGPAEFLAAASLFGEPMEDQNRRYVVEDVPLVSVLSNRHTDSRGKPAKVAANATWHTDHTNQACPPKVTCLYPVALPDSGGGTSICNMRAAWDALSPDWQARIADMQTENTLISSARAATGNPDVVADQSAASGEPMVHPLVRTHPERGTRAIWFPPEQDRARDRHEPGADPEVPWRTARSRDQARVHLHPYLPTRRHAAGGQPFRNAPGGLRLRPLAAQDALPGARSR